MADANLLFAQCNAIYVRGVRRAFQERLQSAYGDDWWEMGVMSALQEDQRNNLETQIQRYPARDPVTTLDHAHFGWIVRRHAAAAFSDIFSDSDAAYWRFRRVALMRNDWAHVQSISMPGVMRVIETMKNILASLRRREALEIEKLSQEVEVQPGYSADDSMGETYDDMEEIDIDYTETDSEHPSADFWTQLKSYLSLDTSVEITEDNRANIMVHISNTAPVGDNVPEVYFDSVQVEVRNAGAIRHRRGDTYSGLGPGQSREIQYVSDVASLAFVEFDVSGQLDWNRFLRFHQKTSLPREVAIPILERFIARLEDIDIKAPLTTALDSLRQIGPSTTLADLASARTELRQIGPLIDAKNNGINELWREFHLERRTSPGRECREIADLFGQVVRKLDGIDNAIGNTDLDTIAQIVHDIEQIQLAVIRIENTMKEMINR